MQAKPQELAEVPSVFLPSGKDEMNFAEFPIALLTDRAPKGQKTIRFEDTIYDERRKKQVTRRRIIEGSEEYGLPTATDDTVILGLIQISKIKSDFQRRDVEFTRLELIRLLGWPNEGKSYDRIKLSLQRIANVTYNYDNAWWDPKQKTWTTKIFHIIDTVEITDSRSSDGQGGLFPSRIVWNEVVFDSFQAGFLRNIDFRLCMSLEHPTALRMYRFLGKRFHLRPDWTFDLKEFAYEHVGLGRNYEGGTQIARKLQPALDELEKAAFLEPLDKSERFFKTGKDWSIRLIQKHAAPPALTLMPGPSQTHTEEPGLVGMLVQRGVTRSKAIDLVQHHAASTLEAKIEVFDSLVQKQDKRVARNPAGFLVKSIQDDYAAPKDFVCKAERQRGEEARQARESKAANARREQQEEAARKRAEEAVIRAYWESLTPKEQTEMDAAARAQADPETLAVEEGPLRESLGRLGQQLRRDAHIRELLLEQKKLPIPVEYLQVSPPPLRPLT
jgi:Replication initiator protein A